MLLAMCEVELSRNYCPTHRDLNDASKRQLLVRLRVVKHWSGTHRCKAEYSVSRSPYNAVEMLAISESDHGYGAKHAPRLVDTMKTRNIVHVTRQ